MFSISLKESIWSIRENSVIRSKTSIVWRKVNAISDGMQAPWFDGLVYETIRGVADLMARQSDVALEKRVDGYIDRIAVAQASEPNGYIDTYTQLMEADHQWGERGGMLRW